MHELTCMCAWQLSVFVRAVRKIDAVHSQEKWDQTEEKPAVVAITLASFVAVWAASGVVDAVDKLPLIGGLLEFVGLVVTGWCALMSPCHVGFEG